MRLPQPFEDKIMRSIRDAYAIDPILSYAALQEALERKFDRKFSAYYVKKMCEKSHRTTLMEINRSKIAPRLVQLRETHRMARERLMKVAFYSGDNWPKDVKPPLPLDIIEAAKGLVQLDIAVLREEVANGVYKDEQEAAAEELSYKPLNEEQRTVIVGVFTKWGKIPPQQVEAIVLPVEKNGTDTSPSIAVAG